MTSGKQQQLNIANYVAPADNSRFRQSVTFVLSSRLLGESDHTISG